MRSAQLLQNAFSGVRAFASNAARAGEVRSSSAATQAQQQGASSMFGSCACWPLLQRQMRAHRHLIYPR